MDLKNINMNTTGINIIRTNLETMDFDLEYKLQLFREEQPELFDAKGKRYTGTRLSNETAEMMFELINELEGALVKVETGEEVVPLCGYFEPANINASATKCKCGREKWEH
jgi:hypothetical protein